jgi:uncharacterized protein YggE
MDKEKKSLYQILTAFIAVIIVLAVYSVFWGPIKDLGDANRNQRTVAITATGKTSVKPDVALISFSAVTEGKDTQKIADENNAKINKIIEFIKQQGIEAKDISTTQYTLTPVYTQQVRSMALSATSAPQQTFVPTIAQYSLTQGVEVKVRDFSKISTIMNSLISLGANRVNDVSFSIDDQEKFLGEARAKAFEQVKQKAESMSEQGGFKLGRIINVSEYSNTPYPYARNEAKAFGMGGAADVSMAAPTIEPGSTEVSTSVTIVYEIK